ncbi:hypothetical protein O6H91_06G026600 [Diphasiastrum complanatum]|uniref:Uncharacterized protein n=1 Tax=Diphasiastrum complanatum TaxID=34168 RepID=A0ACC2DC87_DIPCM|nr:hypothetical protein O6H91_06G026600 [Diphasiastrum complanatum]
MDENTVLDGMPVSESEELYSTTGMHNLKEGEVSKVVQEASFKVNSLPLAVELFGVAVALAALGAIVRQSNGQIDIQGIQVKARLRNEWLCDLALKPRNCIAQSKERSPSFQRIKLAQQTWHAEKMELLSKLAQAESHVEELKRMRVEDAKANEKVVTMFAIQEQCWKNERKRLRHENEVFKKRVEILLDKIRVNFHERGSNCLECKQKERSIVNLKEKLTEKDFLLITTMEEAKAEQLEKNELAGKLAVAEMLAEYVQEKLDNQLKEHDECLVNYGMEMSALISKQKELKADLESTVKELDISKQEAAALNEFIQIAQESKKKLLAELKNLKKDIKSKDVVLSVMLRKNGLATAENFELARKLAHVKARKRNLESERDGWRRIAEERINESLTTNSLRPGCSFGRRLDSGATKLSEMQRLHAEQVYNLHRMYKNQIKDLEHQVQFYLDRLLKLENCILCGIREEKDALSSENVSLKKPAVSLTAPIPDLSTRRVNDCMEAKMDNPQLQLSCAKNFVVEFMDSGRGMELELGKWRKLYMGAKATIDILQDDSTVAKQSEVPHMQQWEESYKDRQTIHLEQRHWHEIDAFERQMRAKDERMEGFRQQLVLMDEAAKKMKVEIDELKKEIQKVTQRSLEAESLLRKKEIELNVCKEGLLQYNASNFNLQPYIGVKNKVKVEQEEIAIDSTELLAVRKTMSCGGKHPEGSLLMVLEQAEAELYEQDVTLAFLEAKLVQAMMRYEKEKKARERESYEILIEKSFIENILLETLVGGRGPASEYALNDSHLEADALPHNISTRNADTLCAHGDYEINKQCPSLVILEPVEFLTRVQVLVSPEDLNQSLVRYSILDSYTIKQLHVNRNEPSKLQSQPNGKSFVRLQSYLPYENTSNGRIYVLQVQYRETQKSEQLGCGFQFPSTSGFKGEWNTEIAAAFENNYDIIDQVQLNKGPEPGLPLTRSSFKGKQVEVFKDSISCCKWDIGVLVAEIQRSQKCLIVLEGRSEFEILQTLSRGLNGKACELQHNSELERYSTVIQKVMTLSNEKKSFLLAPSELQKHVGAAQTNTSMEFATAGKHDSHMCFVIYMDKLLDDFKEMQKSPETKRIRSSSDLSVTAENER